MGYVSKVEKDPPTRTERRIYYDNRGIPHYVVDFHTWESSPKRAAYVEYEVFEVIQYESVPSGEPLVVRNHPDALELIGDGYCKWDGCGGFMSTHGNGYIHLCDLIEVVRFGKMMVWVAKQIAELHPDQEARDSISTL